MNAEPNSDENNEINKEIKKQWKEYEDNTKILSNCIRRLAFAETAVFWILSKNGVNLSDIIILGFLSIVLCLIFDSLQYYSGQKVYYKKARNSEQKWSENSNIKLNEIKRTRDTNNRMKFFFNLKLFAISVASFLLIIQFARQIFCSN